MPTIWNPPSIYGCECYPYVQELRSRRIKVDGLQFDYVPQHLNARTAKVPPTICDDCALLLNSPIEMKLGSRPLKRYFVSEEPLHVWDATAYYKVINVHNYEGRRVKRQRTDGSFTPRTSRVPPKVPLEPRTSGQAKRISRFRHSKFERIYRLVSPGNTSYPRTASSSPEPVGRHGEMLWDHSLALDIENTQSALIQSPTSPAMRTAFPSVEKPVDIVDTEMTPPSSSNDHFSDVQTTQHRSFQFPLSPPLSPSTCPAPQPLPYEQTPPPSFTFPTPPPPAMISPPQTPPQTTFSSPDLAAAAFQDFIDRCKLVQSQPSPAFIEKATMDMTPTPQPNMATPSLNQSLFINQANRSRTRGQSAQQRHKESQRNARASAQSSHSSMLPSKKKPMSNQTTRNSVSSQTTKQQAQPVAPSSRIQTPIIDDSDLQYMNVYNSPPASTPKPQQSNQSTGPAVMSIPLSGAGYSKNSKACQPKRNLTQPPAQNTQTSAQTTRFPSLNLVNKQSQQAFRQPTVETVKDEPELDY